MPRDKADSAIPTDPASRKAEPLYAIVLDELSLLPFLWHAFLDREIALIAIRPVVPVLRGLLDRAARWATGCRRACWAVAYVPELTKDWRWHPNLYFRNVYARCEPWQDAYFGMPREDGETDDYAYAFNHVTATYVYDKAIEIYAIEALDRNLTNRDVVKIGLSADTVAFFTDHFGKPLENVRHRARGGDRVLNAAIVLLVIATTLIWMTARMRFRVRPEQVFCIVDRLGNAQEELLIEELREGGDIVSFDRSQTRIPGNTIAWGAGRFSPACYAAAATEMVMRVCELWYRYGSLCPRHFFQVASLPRKAIMWRALFNLVRPRHFIGRDEYNSDHILRGGELARCGGVSHGLSGAVYAAYTAAAPNSRYVSFDHLYVVGTGVVIRDRWRRRMRLHPIGTWGYPGNRFSGPMPPGNDILISVRIAFEEEEMISIIQAVARAFPCRTVLVQMKPVTFLAPDEVDRLKRAYRGELTNIEIVDEPVYKLVERAKFHISDISTLVAESIHRGAYCFVADVLGHQTCCYREFPGLCVTTADEAVARLRRIENREEAYPRNDYMTRLGVAPDTVAFDVIRATMGLKPRYTARRCHLNSAANKQEPRC